MPLRSQGFDDRVGNRLLAFLAFVRVAMGMAINTPGISILLDKGGGRIEGLCDNQYAITNIRTRTETYITTLSTEKVSNMPLGTTSNHNLTLNRGLATLASRAEEFMVV